LNLGFKNIAGTTIPDLKEEITMRQRFTRRDVLKRSSAVLATTIFASPVKSAAPEPSTITPALIEAARKEGRVSYYTSIDLSLAEKLAKAFEAKFSGISVHVERTGAERVFQRIGQEYASSIHAVDVVNSSDASHFVAWKREGVLAPFMPEDVAKFYRASTKTQMECSRASASRSVSSLTIPIL
jgi:iron(III) transport system substrate-binding protein